jgi:E3 ubiquitin-protein ligase SIAH1
MKMKCELTHSWNLSLSCGDQVEHSQESKFTATCTDRSTGLPNPDEDFQFVVPNSVLADDDKEKTIKVGFRIANNS